jgi:hypothetical protein
VLFCQHPGLRYRGEQFDIQEFIPESAVDRLHKWILTTSPCNRQVPPVVEGDYVDPQLLGDLRHALAVRRVHPPTDISLDGLAVGTN